ncbi:1,3-beta-galactosyl-N-acetylhexosamine phosphorylase C-terminal domain-containing protein, partial [Bifidobacterium bifidum]
ALFWASHNEGKYAAYSSSNPECEVAVFDKSGCYCVVNNTDRAQSTYVERGDGRIERIELAPSGIAWRTI